MATTACVLVTVFATRFWHNATAMQGSTGTSAKWHIVLVSLKRARSVTATACASLACAGARKDGVCLKERKVSTRVKCSCVHWAAETMASVSTERVSVSRDGLDPTARILSAQEDAVNMASALSRRSTALGSASVALGGLEPHANALLSSRKCVVVLTIALGVVYV